MISNMSLGRWALLAVVSLCGLWLFFLEYLPPLQAVSMHSDLQGYHYPLLNFAWHEIRNGRLPLWDPVIYCGISYAGIIQEALTYPPNWLLFLSAPLTKGLLQKNLEVLLMLHLWAGFLFCFGWLRTRLDDNLAAFAGAAAFAFGGMPLAQSQHLGVVNCYVWIPSALWAIEKARQTSSLRPWMLLSAASAMAFLAGYPPAFLAFITCAVCWSAAVHGLRRGLVRSLASLGFSLLLAGVKLLPALQSAELRVYEKSYSGGLPHGAFTALLPFLPNYFDGALPPSGVLPWGDSLYVGGPVICGLAAIIAALALRRCSAPVAAPCLTIGCAAVLMANPFGAVDAAVSLSPSLAAALREYNLLPCVTVSLCCLGAYGVACLRRNPPLAIPRFGAICIALLTFAWCARLLAVWLPGGVEFASGWATLLDAAVATILACALLLAPRNGPASRAAAAAFVALSLIELKAFGTSRRFSAEQGHPDRKYRALRDMRTGGHAMAGMEQAVFDRLRAHPWHRVIVLDGMHPLDLHHYGLLTPQGFEASLPAQYRRKIADYVPWSTNRLFTPDPADRRFLDDFAVRFAICRSGGPAERHLLAMQHWLPLGSGSYYFRVFEYAAAQPLYRWSGAVSAPAFAPARRVFHLDSPGGGRFELLEQNLPGWSASLDGGPVRIERFNGVFQSVMVPPGRHELVFEYRPLELYAGAAISLAAWIILMAAWRRSGKPQTA